MDLFFYRKHTPVLGMKTHGSIWKYQFGHKLWL